MKAKRGLARNVRTYDQREFQRSKRVGRHAVPDCCRKSLNTLRSEQEVTADGTKCEQATQLSKIEALQRPR